MKNIIVCIFCLLLSSCGLVIDGNNYTNKEPKFNLYDFFEGRVNAWGIVQDRNGEVIQQFTVSINGNISVDDTLILDEKFIYQIGDGVTTRVWKITKNGNNLYKGSASDILHNAEGQVYGNALNWRYEMQLPVGDTSYKVSFDDWMWAFDDKTLMNRSYITKFGIVMAEVTIFMQKEQ